MLDLSKVESGSAELHEENVSVSSIMESCLRLMRERAHKGGVDLESEVARGAALALHADARMLKQILVNLLSNAVKFTPAGGKVLIKAWHNPQSGYVLQVVDTGIGMALDDIPKALARFGQVDSELARKYEGTGLGLPLTKALVELHGGHPRLPQPVLPASCRGGHSRRGQADLPLLHRRSRPLRRSYPAEDRSRPTRDGDRCRNSFRY